MSFKIKSNRIIFILQKNLLEKNNFFVKSARSFLKQDPGLLIAYGILFLIWILNVDAIPWLDAANEVAKKQIYFYQGDFGAYKQAIGMYATPDGLVMDHPLGRIAILTAFLLIFGMNSFAATLPGFLLNLAAVFSIYKICIKFANPNCARIAAILLACDPLFIATSIHTLPDHFYAAVALVACYAYSYNKTKLWCVALVVAALTKETALLLIFAFIGQWIISVPFSLREKKILDYKKILIPIAVVCLYFLYLKIIKSFGVGPWSFAGKSGFASVVENLHDLVGLKRLIMGNFFEHYNWLSLTIFNFQWLINALACWWFVVFFASKFKKNEEGLSEISLCIARIVMSALTLIFIYFAYYFFEWKNYILSIGVFIILPTAYFFSVTLAYHLQKNKSYYFESPFFAIFLMATMHVCLVLTFNTWSIPRYVLPVTVFLIIPASFFVDFLSCHVGKTVRYFLYAAGLCVMAVRFFVSADPITSELKDSNGQLVYAVERLYGETYYRDRVSNLDFVVYNNQYLSMLSKRSDWYRELADLKLDAQGYIQAIRCNDLSADDYHVLAAFTDFSKNYEGYCHRE